MNISSRTKGVLMAVIGSIFWGGSGVAAQFILQEKGMTADGSLTLQNEKNASQPL